MPDRDWMIKAACRGYDPENWFPEDLPPRDRRRAVLAAKRICQSCPVYDECSEYADAYNTTYGIWGGERRTIRIFPPLTRKTCGTAAGYLSHRRYRERACERCKAAQRDDARARRAEGRLA